MTTFALDGMDLAALLCSRVCHDVISPVGAIINGLEVLEDEKEAEMREIALDLIKKSAAAASARLQFCRLAYGAAGSVGASIDTGDAENVTRGLINNDRTKLVWNNLCLIAISVIPRGGVVTVALSGEGEALEALVEAKGPNARLAHGVAALIAGTVEGGSVDAHSIQAYYTGLVARSCGLQVTIETAADSIALRASLAVETALAAPG
jgi:histidine phosphotransferase ChpT